MTKPRSASVTSMAVSSTAARRSERLACEAMRALAWRLALYMAESLRNARPMATTSFSVAWMSVLVE